MPKSFAALEHKIQEIRSCRDVSSSQPRNPSVCVLTGVLKLQRQNHSPSLGAVQEMNTPKHSHLFSSSFPIKSGLDRCFCPLFFLRLPSAASVAMFYLTTNKKVYLNYSIWDSSHSNVTRWAGAFQMIGKFAKETHSLGRGLYTTHRQKVGGSHIFLLPGRVSIQSGDLPWFAFLFCQLASTPASGHIPSHW